jgi:hypothetical protein
MILALLPNAVMRSRLLRGLHHGRVEARFPAVLFAGSWREVLEHLNRVPPDALVFDPHLAAAEDAGSYHWIRRHASSTGLVAYGCFRLTPASRILLLATNGVHAVVSYDLDDDRDSMSHYIAAALTRGIRADLHARLAERFPPDLHPLLRTLLEAGKARLTPVEAAASCFCHPETLRAKLRRHGLPPRNVS